jgi:beta-lysine N6-acetyltransferase
MDKTETLQGATLQHGPFSNRIYLMKLGTASPQEIMASMAEMILKNGYTKIFCKLPHSMKQPFLKMGYQLEATIPGFYGGQEAAAFLGYYMDKSRSLVTNADQLDEIMMIAREKQGAGFQRVLSGDACLRRCTEQDVGAMAKLYGLVFASYPFPIHDPDYLLETMRSHVDYFGVEVEGRLVALSSAEMDMESQSSEMTDFATHPDFTGRGYAAHLLAAMEPAITAKGIKTAYTIARAESAGMNITFARLGYTFGGRLPNNTQIFGDIETMNVWYKKLDSSTAQDDSL